MEFLTVSALFDPDIICSGGYYDVWVNALELSLAFCI